MNAPEPYSLNQRCTFRLGRIPNFDPIECEIVATAFSPAWYYLIQFTDGTKSVADHDELTPVPVAVPSEPRRA